MSTGAGVPRTWRPLGPRVAGVVAGAVLVLIVSMLWIGFDEDTRQSVTLGQRTTVVLLVLGWLVLLWALGRSRVTARTEGLVVVNGFRRHDLEWAQVVAAHLPPGAPWVTLDLADGNTLAVMGIQATDGRRARIAVRELRALVDGPPSGPPA